MNPGGRKELPPEIRDALSKVPPERLSELLREMAEAARAEQVKKP